MGINIYEFMVQLHDKRKINLRELTHEQFLKEWKTYIKKGGK